MRCSDVEALWDETRGDGEKKSERALAHLRHCNDCQCAYREFEGVAYCLTCLPIVEPPQNLVPRILEHIRALQKHFRSTVPDDFVRMPSPIGNLLLAWRETRITFVGIDLAGDEEAAKNVVETRLKRPLRDAEAPAWVRDAVAKYFKTWHVDIDRIDTSEMSAFERLALLKAAQIPPGQVRSYGWIAKEIGHPQSARAVGQVMARNPVALFFPCHRVVDASGSLHNYNYGIELKARILSMEGYVASVKIGAGSPSDAPPRRARASSPQER